MSIGAGLLDVTSIVVKCNKHDCQYMVSLVFTFKSIAHGDSPVSSRYARQGFPGVVTLYKPRSSVFVRA